MPSAAPVPAPWLEVVHESPVCRPTVYAHVRGEAFGILDQRNQLVWIEADTICVSYEPNGVGGWRIHWVTVRGRWVDTEGRVIAMRESYSWNYANLTGAPLWVREFAVMHRPQWRPGLYEGADTR